MIPSSEASSTTSRLASGFQGTTLGSTHGSRIEVKPFWPRTRRRLESEDVSTLSGPSSLLLRNHVESPMPSSLPGPRGHLGATAPCVLVAKRGDYDPAFSHLENLLEVLDLRLGRPPDGEHHPCITKRPLLGGINRWMPRPPSPRPGDFPVQPHRGHQLRILRVMGIGCPTMPPSALTQGTPWRPEGRLPRHHCPVHGLGARNPCCSTRVLFGGWVLDLTCG